MSCSYTIIKQDVNKTFENIFFLAIKLQLKIEVILVILDTSAVVSANTSEIIDPK